MAIALLSALSLSQSNAQSLGQEFVTVVPNAKQDLIKVIYNYDGHESVDVKFIDSDGLIVKDKICGNSFDHGFAKNYKVQRQKRDDFRVVVSNPELQVSYKLTMDKSGNWIAQFEKATQSRLVAAR